MALAVELDSCAAVPAAARAAAHAAEAGPSETDKAETTSFQDDVANSNMSSQSEGDGLMESVLLSPRKLPSYALETSAGEFAKSERLTNRAYGSRLVSVYASLAFIDDEFECQKNTDFVCGCAGANQTTPSPASATSLSDDDGFQIVKQGRAA